MGIAALPTACFFHLDDPIKGREREAGAVTGAGGATESGGAAPAGGTSDSGGGPTSPGSGGSVGVGAAGTTADTGSNACSPGMKRCGEACVRIDDSAFGCTDTGCAPCPNLATSVSSCAGGRCEVRGCLPGYGDCDGSDDDGCEVHFDELPKANGPVASVDARRAAAAITIDGLGTEADWTATVSRRTPIADVCLHCTTESPIPPVLDPTLPPPQDLSAWFRVAWDDYFLYALFEVRDDQIITMPHASDAGDLGKLGPSVVEDAVEVLFSTDHSAGGFGVDDMQLFFGVDGSIERTFQPVPPKPNESAVKVGRGCYTVELKLSFAYLTANPNYSVMPGQVLGFTAAVNDWDDEPRDGGEVPVRESHLFSKNPGDGYWNSAMGFANVVLTAP